MQVPLQIVFRGMDPSPALEDEIRQRVSKLERFFEHIISCRVAVEAPPLHPRKESVYEVRLDIVVPGAELVVAREPGKNQAHKDAYIALRDAFAAATRQLEDFARKRRREVKVHETPPHGTVVRIVRESPEDAYGFLETSDALRVYFHRNSVAGDGFDALALGDEVRFVLAEGEGEKGPQASTVAPVSPARYPG